MTDKSTQVGHRRLPSEKNIELAYNDTIMSSGMYIFGRIVYSTLICMDGKLRVTVVHISTASHIVTSSDVQC
jgi:hypothetical protein